MWTINAGVSECAELSPNISTMLPMSRAMSQMWHDMWICQWHSGRSDFLNNSYKYSFVLSSPHEDEKVIMINQTNTFVSVDWSIMILDYSWINSFYFKSDCDNKHWQQGGWMERTRRVKRLSSVLFDCWWALRLLAGLECYKVI